MGQVIYNGVSTKQLNLEVQTFPELAIPEKEYIATHVPGRSGDVLIDAGSYKNVNRTYKLGLDGTTHGFYNVAQKMITWLYSSSGYARLEDSYEPEYFRMAVYNETAKNIPNVLAQIGSVDITFNCKPQKYLKRGHVRKYFDGAGTLVNPTAFESLPVIQFVCPTVPGELVISSDRGEVFKITVLEAIEHPIIINSEVQEVMGLTDTGLVNLYESVSFSSWDSFPTLSPGTTTFNPSGGVSQLSVVPRWWTL